MLIILLALLIILLVLTLPVAAVLFGLGLITVEGTGSLGLYNAVGSVLWSAADNFVLLAIPLFILIGQILVASGMAEGTYKALDSWLAWLPGGLLHANIGTATFFAATSGSSVATAATVGTMAIPQGERLEYDQRLFTGSIAAGGTLGIMIPPSINLIIYGFLAQTSVPKLFAAGIVPGLLLSTGFIVTTIILCSVWPKLGGKTRRYTWAERIYGVRAIGPVAVLFVAIVGTIYLGWATPTEAAALGVCTVCILALLQRRLTWDLFNIALVKTARTSAMLVIIIMAAYWLNFVLATTGIIADIGDRIEGFGGSAYGVLALVIMIYVILGCFFETITLMVLTIPIFVPIIVAAGFDKTWFGIILIILIEMALITPPVGLNIFVVQGVRERGDIKDVIVGVMPYLATMVAVLLILIMIPGLVMYLPNRM